MSSTGGPEQPSPVEAEVPAQAEREREDQPRIYVASLSDYNAGRLHGVWLDAAQDPAALYVGIAGMLAASKDPGAEEWAIHDHDGFGQNPLSEYEPIERVSLLARGITEHGEAFAAWWSVSDPTLAGLEELGNQFEEHYQGEWDSITDYAEHLLDELGATEALEAVPDWLQGYISLHIEGFARDLEMNGDVCTVPSGPGGVFVFDREWS